MCLAELSPERFFRAVAEVNRTIADEDRYSGLLKEASNDTPIIETILRELAVLMRSEPSPIVEKGIAAAERDLTVLLALRAIEVNDAE